MEEKIERIAKNIVHCAYKVHKELGPGLLEKVYEICLVHELEKCGYNVKRQVEIPIVYDGMTFKEGLRLDIVVENEIIIEVKAVELVNAVWEAQIISQLKITNMKLGFLINFTVPLIKNGIRRFINSNNK
jgi:GxxExxY protein